MNSVLNMHTRLSDCGRELGVFLYSADPDQRRSLCGHLRVLGATEVSFPGAGRARAVPGRMEVVRGTAHLTFGPVVIVGALEVPTVRLENVSQATVFVLDDPFAPNSRNGKILMAATVPLKLPEREKDT